MKTLERIATSHPLWFVLLATAGWVVTAGLGAFLAARALRISGANALSQSLGMLLATGCLLAVMWSLRWLRPAGVTVLGSGRLWLISAALAVYLVAAYQLAFFGRIALNPLDVWHSEAFSKIVARQAVVGVAEEALFRGLLLYALVRVWASSLRGLLAAIAVPALIFGVLHILQVLVGNPIEDTAMTMVNAFVGGVWLAALVLLGGSIWPAVLLHAVTNAAVQIPASMLAGFSPTAFDYTLATAADVPLVVTGLWLLTRRTLESGAAHGDISQDHRASAGV